MRFNFGTILGFFKTSNRSANIRANVIGSLFLRGVSILLSLVIVPLTINFISPYQYGVWITISSIIGWLSFFDIGFGNGLKNKFVEAVTKGKIKLAKIYVSTTYGILTIIIVGIWALCLVLSRYIDWAAFLNVKGISNDQFISIWIIVLSTFAFQFILGLINTILMAVQKPIVTSIINVISQLLTLIGIYLLSYTELGSILVLSLLVGIINTAVLVISSLYLFKTILSKYTPSIGYIKFRYAKGLLSMGINFFILQIIAIVYYETNNIIISKILDPLHVTTYSLAFKYVSVVGMLFNIVIAPFWSAFIEARVLNDLNWMESETKKLYQVYGGFIIATVLLVAVSSTAYQLWFGKAVSISFLLTALMGVWQILNMWNSLHSTLIYGFGKVRLQLIGSISVGVLNVPLTIFFCNKWGLPGVVVSQIILSLSIAWVGPIQLKLLFYERAKGIWNR